MLDVSSPNLWSFLIAAVQTLVTLAGIIVAYLQTRKGQDPKLDTITATTNKTHDVANGRLDAALAKAAAYEKQLRDSGQEPRP